MLPLMPQFNVERYIEAMGRYRATVISGVPTMTSMVLARRDLLAKTDVTSVHTVMMGSAPASLQILRDLKVGRMRLLATPRKMPSMTGFGLEVVGYADSPRSER